MTDPRDLDRLEALLSDPDLHDIAPGRRYVDISDATVDLYDEARTAIPALIAEVRRLRAQNLNFRAAIEQIMPRYVELFTYAGLGDPSESVAVQLARDVMAQS